MTSSSKTNLPNFKTKTARISVKYLNYVNLTSLSEEQLNERTPSPPTRKKSLSPPEAPSKSISSKTNIPLSIITKLWSDHNPILLHIDKNDFGPSPFKLYNSWILRDGFDNLIKEEWELLDSNLKCHEKLRRLKDKIKQWSNNIKTLERNRKTIALEEINSIEKRIDEGSAMPFDNDHRLILFQEIEKIDKFASMDLIQKARNQMINEIMVEGNWITNPCLIKDAFLQFYKRKFQAQDTQVTLEEINEAVWDCESSKALGPDGYSFAFMKKYWVTIQKDLYDFVNLFFATCVMPNGANSSFFTLIPKVNNPNLITDFRLISLIGINYKIIAKILANRLSKVIDKIVSKEQSAFIAGRQILDGPVILSEIIECLLNSLRASILINGSPTSEFSIKRDLRQGDHLSPFLFILVMEGLHNAFEEAVGNGMITSVNINNSTINVSHLFFVDDVIITTDWNARDMDNIIHEVFSMASNAGCIAADIPFSYLGLPIGSNMKSIASWKTLVDHFQMRLSSCKANLLSVRGRLTLIKSVLGSLGGLNIGSLKAFNLALLQKWRWRLLSSPNALWVKVIKAYHGLYHGQEGVKDASVIGIDHISFPLLVCYYLGYKSIPGRSMHLCGGFLWIG
ncbi:RNA-directed DNA polymerase, eukaryota, reverse transcriptase zinc-binding domain protein [Tanacetum coccineum]